jgi:hypothetical protein
MKPIKGLLVLSLCGALQAQDSGFNPLKELQTVPNASRITVSIAKLPFFSISRRATIMVDGVRVADGDSDNPPTFEPEVGKEFIFEVCTLSRSGDLMPNFCAFGGVMRPRENTLYKFEYKNNQSFNYLIFLGKQSF